MLLLKVKLASQTHNQALKACLRNLSKSSYLPMLSLGKTTHDCTNSLILHNGNILRDGFGDVKLRGSSWKF